MLAAVNLSSARLKIITIERRDIKRYTPANPNFNNVIRINFDQILKKSMQPQ